MPKWSSPELGTRPRTLPHHWQTSQQRRSRVWPSKDCDRYKFVPSYSVPPVIWSDSLSPQGAPAKEERKSAVKREVAQVYDLTGEGDDDVRPHREYKIVKTEHGRDAFDLTED